MSVKIGQGDMNKDFFRDIKKIYKQKTMQIQVIFIHSFSDLPNLFTGRRDRSLTQGFKSIYSACFWTVVED